MTRHDPFSYGQVSLGAGKKPAAESPDELLFADAGPAKKAPPADSSWELLEGETASSLLPCAAQTQATADFAADILGEAAPAQAPAAKAESAPSRPAMVRPQPQGAGPAVRVPAAAPATAAATAKTAAQGAAGSGVPAAAPRMAGRAVRLPHALPPRASRLTSTVVPAVLFVAGGSTATWLYAVQHNLVMAGIVGALSLVATVYTRVWLRS